ncbi:hypothetical protein [Glutamicibacter sp.]|uniref:hypothetical protein n=1 Tax=Glutamicibacter sp. TaxID=1931995 RepID=UPI0028BEE102|nr:hypothetical protein [Glutamicibacter sp.]
MKTDDELQTLRARVEELERENAALNTKSAPGKGRRWRAVVSALLIAIAVLVAPIAVIGTWTHSQLADTDKFVATVAPLTKDPAVQAYITDEVVAAINDKVDIDALVSDAFDGIATLDLPPKAAAALGLLEAPAANGAHNMINTAVSKVVASPQFSTVIEEALRQTHSRAIAIIQQQPGTAVTLSEDGTVSLQLGVVVERVKAQLQAQGFGFADAIPAIDKSIPLATDSSLASVRAIYNISVVGGYWLPWVVLVLAGVGIALARRRLRALSVTGLALGIAFAATWMGVFIGRTLFVGTIAPVIMPRDVALAIYSQLTAAVVSALVALVVLALGIALGGWFASGAQSAMSTRGVLNRGFSSVRVRAARGGISTGAFGRGIEKFRLTILVLAAVGAVIVIFLNRPATFSLVLGSIITFLVIAILVELLRHPAELDEIQSQKSDSNLNLDIASGDDDESVKQ